MGWNPEETSCAVSEPRRCEYCGELLVRKIRQRSPPRQHLTYKETMKTFLLRRFCNARCRNNHVAKIVWADETHRDKMIATWTTPEQRLIRSQNMRQRWQDGSLLDSVHQVKRRTTPDWNGLAEEQIRAIIIDPRPYREISSSYQVSNTTISDIKHGKIYADIEDRPEPVINHISKRWGLSRLSDADITAVLADTRHYGEIANDYKISTTYVSFLKRGLKRYYPS